MYIYFFSFVQDIEQKLAVFMLINSSRSWTFTLKDRRKLVKMVGHKKLVGIAQWTKFPSKRVNLLTSFIRSYFDIVFNRNKSLGLNPKSELSSTYLVVQIQATFKNGFVHCALKKEATPTQQDPPHLIRHFNICVCILLYFCILKIIIYFWNCKKWLMSFWNWMQLHLENC